MSLSNVSMETPSVFAIAGFGVAHTTTAEASMPHVLAHHAITTRRWDKCLHKTTRTEECVMRFRNASLPLFFPSLRNAMGVAALSLAVLVGCLPAFSQGNAGRILGGVTDQTGGFISGATVTIIDTQRNLARTLTADAAGEYNAPNLLPGTYTVRAAYQGFKTEERSGVILEVNQDLRVDLTLQPGQQTERIVVTEALPMVETSNAELGRTLQSEIIAD